MEGQGQEKVMRWGRAVEERLPVGLCIYIPPSSSDLSQPGYDSCICESNNNGYHL